MSDPRTDDVDPTAGDPAAKLRPAEGALDEATEADMGIADDEEEEIQT